MPPRGVSVRPERRSDQVDHGEAGGRRRAATGQRTNGIRTSPQGGPALLDWSDWSIPHDHLQIGRPRVEVVIVPDAKAGGELIAEAMAALVRRKPDALLGVATGSTPLPIYEALAAKVKAGQVDASRPASASSTSTSACRPGTPSPTAPSSCARSWSRWACPRPPSWARTARPRTSSARARPTTGRWPRPAASTSSCWASARTATSASTSPAPRSPPAPASRR